MKGAPDCCLWLGANSVPLGLLLLLYCSPFWSRSYHFLSCLFRVWGQGFVLLSDLAEWGFLFHCTSIAFALQNLKCHRIHGVMYTVWLLCDSFFPTWTKVTLGNCSMTSFTHNSTTGNLGSLTSYTYASCYLTQVSGRKCFLLGLFF